MAQLLAKLGEFFGFTKDEAEAEAKRQALALEFRIRCGQFRMLISSNNQALEIMAEMEEALAGRRMYGMSWIKACCAGVTANVYKMVRCLNEMTGGKHQALHGSLGQLHARLSGLVDKPLTVPRGPLVLQLNELRASMADQAGPKMANLGEVASTLGIEVPQGFVITASGFRSFLGHQDLGLEILSRIQATDMEKYAEVEALSESVRELVLQAELPPDLVQALDQGLDDLEKRLGPDLKLALRSSALGEDLPGASFAGQFHTELDVPINDRSKVMEAYKEVVASNYGFTAMSYRMSRGIPDQDVVMCVGCLAMIDAAAGGVLYTRDPLDPGGETMVVNAVPGLPKGVVDGSADPHITILSRSPSPAVQAMPSGQDDHGSDRAQPAQPEQEPCLPQERVLELARSALLMEKHFGHELDVEWALDKAGRLIVLQARHLSMTERRDAAGLTQGMDQLLQGGVTASLGLAAGPACCVHSKDEAEAFVRGGVLVVAQALPRWAPLMAKAAGLIAETGSPAGHLGNVAREFDVPAVFGLKGALAALHDAGPVTLDADQCRVFAGQADIPPAPKREAKLKRMQQSPAAALLKEACALITPLNLLDAASPDFAPHNCRTLHDITRYCHEKSVSEMFSPAHGREALSASKRLHHGAPLKYWIIDLGGGFKGPVRGKYVRIPEIASTPMLALWNGMLAVPWDGPPAMDAKGFLSVVGQAASNPALDPTRRSAFEVRNYFMISETFVSLQARYGFHFCTVEGLAGDDPDQNYATFRFTGGAADLDRRELRAAMIADILESRGFRTEVKYDAVSARAEALPGQEILGLLEVIGYLIIHTRQLDMIMKNDATAATYKRKILADLDKLAAPST